MFKKGSKVYAIVKMKCPSCHEGDLFVHKNPYDFRNMSKMHNRCPVCNQNYEPEPNFYYGSMYVSYAYTVALFVAVYVIFGAIIGLGIWTVVGILAGLLIVLSPYLFRLSRASYINMIIGYKGDHKKAG